MNSKQKKKILILKTARELLVDGQEFYVCVSISRAGDVLELLREIKCEEETTYLLDYIASSLKSGTLETWQAHNGVPISRGIDRTRHRIQWVDWMLDCYELKERK